MKSGGYLFLLGGLFYIITGTIYYVVTREPVGTTALILTAGLAELVAFYLLFTQNRIGYQPEDNDQGEQNEAPADYGFYSPHSWWPLPVALSMCALTLSLIIGWWLTVISLGALVISIIGMVTEYEKPATVSAH